MISLANDRFLLIWIFNVEVSAVSISSLAYSSQ